MSSIRSSARQLVAAVVILMGVPAEADPVEGMVTFSAGTTARAAEVNGNFSEVADSVNDNDARIAALEEELQTLRAQLDNVLNVNQYLSLATVNEQPTVRLTGANLQIVNGMGDTATSNGTGNLLIGYDERRDEALSDPQCSLGRTSDGAPVTSEAECVAAGGLFAVNHTSGSHYLVVGSRHNYSRWGGILAGVRNTGNFDFAGVSGGAGNTAAGPFASVIGGTGNIASGFAASVSGGEGNTASGDRSSVGGGTGNVASFFRASVSGGSSNTASGSASSVTGGSFNSATGAFSSVTGGHLNSAQGSLSSVSGGANRIAAGDNHWVAGSLQEIR